MLFYVFTFLVMYLLYYYIFIHVRVQLFYFSLSMFGEFFVSYSYHTYIYLFIYSLTFPIFHSFNKEYDLDPKLCVYALVSDNIFRLISFGVNLRSFIGLRFQGVNLKFIKDLWTGRLSEQCAGIKSFTNQANY